MWMGRSELSTGGFGLVSRSWPVKESKREGADAPTGEGRLNEWLSPLSAEVCASPSVLTAPPAAAILGKRETGGAGSGKRERERNGVSAELLRDRDNHACARRNV